MNHERNDNFKEFARGDVLIRVGYNDYSAKIIVGFTTGNQMVLYDIVNFTPTHFDIKKEDSSIDFGKSRNLRNEPSSVDTTIPQEQSGVNTSIFENAENDTKNSQLSLSKQCEQSTVGTPLKDLYYGDDIAPVKETAESESNIDNSKKIVYNDNRGETYVRTNEFRSLQAECQGMSDEDIQLYHSGNKQIDDKLRENIARVLRGQIQSYRNGLRYDNGILSLTNKSNEFNMCKSVDGSLFHDVFEIAQKYLRNGELVDLHTVETTEDGIGYNDCYNYLSEDGLSGFSITPKGDIISVFNASGKGGFLSAIAL